MIEAKDVWLRYTPRSSWALAGATISLAPGEVLALAGPNGGGKTTLLKVMAGLLQPERGRVLIGGVDIWRVGEEERLNARRTAVYVGEKPVMVRGSVWDNIVLGLRLRGLEPEGEEERIRGIARSLGIEELLDKQAKSLSAGQAQMVSIARALALQPRALLLDEPFSHLDRGKRALLAKALERLRSQGVAIAIAGHEEAYTLKLASRVAWVEDGRVAVQRPGEELEWA